MALEKTVTDDKIEIVGPYKFIQIRASIKVTDGEELISESYHRRAVMPGQDASNETAEVRALVALYHTADNIAAYKQYIIDSMPPEA
jgi:hypothetical protein